MYEISQLFWYRLLFMGSLFVSEWLFTFRLKRAEHYTVRFLLGMAACVGFAFAVPVLPGLFSLFMFLAMFAFTVVVQKFCYDVPWSNILFCTIAGYTVQHVAYELYSLIVVAAGLNENGGSVGFYETQSSGALFTDPVTEWVYFLVYGVIYWLAFVIFANRLKRGNDLTLKSLSLFALLAVFIAIDIVVSSIVTNYGYVNFDDVYVVLLCLTSILCCCIALFFQFELLNSRRLRSELDIINQLWHKEKEQYYASKENIELINMKCHDIKHQIGSLGTIGADAKREIEKMVSIYDSSVKTDNEVLDIILTEKSLLCNKNDIRFSCMVDGARLNFMAVEDLCSLFGNLIDNAVEAVMGLEKDKRVITLSVKAVRSFLSVSIFNFYAGKLVFENGMPVTRKKDRNYHGFGLKSVELIVRKYGGDFYLNAENNVFTVSILFPEAAE